MKEAHETAWSGHPVVERILALLSCVYLWQTMEEYIEAYVKTCHVCQVEKTECKKEDGFPKVDGMASIMVVAAELFYKNVVKYFGVPSNIVSDRDTRFTGKFWTALFNMIELI
ncbi:hypothetical protein KY285_000663 [Solanum tuberosum]|nr:hypothetical protein KY285_000663 [Solanum tuberosum]